MDRAQREFELDVASAVEAAARAAVARADRIADQTPIGVEERATWGLQLFSECLSPDLQSSVLRGEQAPLVRVADLPSWGRRFVEDLYAQYGGRRRTPDGQLE